MTAHAVLNHPSVRAAMTVSPPRKDRTSSGRTGMTIPSASMSSRIVMNTNATAARRGLEVGVESLIRGFRHTNMGQRGRPGTGISLSSES